MFLASRTDWERLAAALAHDLRDPLYTALGHVDLVRAMVATGAGGDPSESLDALERSLNRALAATEKALGKSPAVARTVHVQRIDASSCAAQALEDLGGLVAERDAHVTVAPLPDVQADPDGLRRVLQNLIANAIRHNDRARPHVEVSASRRPGETVFRVADDGPGVAEEKVRWLLGGPAEDMATEARMGMGLEICRRIVESHGGRMVLLPSAGRGAVFEFTIPDPT